MVGLASNARQEPQDDVVMGLASNVRQGPQDDVEVGLASRCQAGTPGNAASLKNIN